LARNKLKFNQNDPDNLDAIDAEKIDGERIDGERHKNET